MLQEYDKLLISFFFIKPLLFFKTYRFLLYFTKFDKIIYAYNTTIIHEEYNYQKNLFAGSFYINEYFFLFRIDDLNFDY